MEKKNTILLTIIAVATLLVAVIGATFAYFTAQRGDGAQADITVTTSTSDSIIYGEFAPLIVKATQQNFEQGLGSLRGSTEGTITLTSSDNADRGDTADYCYTSTIKISQNDFTYKPAEADSEEPDSAPTTNQPELILSVWKGESEYKEEVIQGLTYQSLDGTYKVCDQTNGEVTEEGCNDEQSIAGYDITEYGKDASSESEAPSTVDIRIPVLNAENTELSEPLLYVHHIKTEETGSTTSITWKASITFVNYEFDQQYNTNKKLIATWVFTPVECETGNPIEQELP